MNRHPKKSFVLRADYDPLRSPRASARLFNNQPLKQRYNSRRMLWLGLVLMLSLATVLLQKSSTILEHINRPVLTVKIENPLQHVSDAEVRAMLLPYLGQGFFSLDVAAIKSELENHPWVVSASLKRVWPDSLSVMLNEEVAIARWNESGLLNQLGEIFVPENIDHQMSLPLLVGEDNAQIKMMEQYQLLSQVLLPLGLKIEQLFENARGSWSLVLNNEITIIAGREKVLEKIQRFARIYDGQLRSEIEQIGAIDLRYENGFAVKKKESELDGVASI